MRQKSDIEKKFDAMLDPKNYVETSEEIAIGYMEAKIKWDHYRKVMTIGAIIGALFAIAILITVIGGLGNGDLAELKEMWMAPVMLILIFSIDFAGAFYLWDHTPGLLLKLVISFAGGLFACPIAIRKLKRELEKWGDKLAKDQKRNPEFYEEFFSENNR